MFKSAGSRNSQKSIFSQKDGVRSKDESWNLAYRDINESSLWTILGHHHDKLEKTKTLDLSYNCLEYPLFTKHQKHLVDILICCFTLNI